MFAEGPAAWGGRAFSAPCAKGQVHGGDFFVSRRGRGRARARGDLCRALCKGVGTRRVFSFRAAGRGRARARGGFLCCGAGRGRAAGFSCAAGRNAPARLLPPTPPRRSCPIFLQKIEKRGLHSVFGCVIILLFPNGGLAQLVRAPASHAGGLGFESLILHHDKSGSYANRQRVRICFYVRQTKRRGAPFGACRRSVFFCVCPVPASTMALYPTGKTQYTGDSEKPFGACKAGTSAVLFPAQERLLSLCAWEDAQGKGAPGTGAACCVSFAAACPRMPAVCRAADDDNGEGSVCLSENAA